jgi:hypothetical protein
MMGTMFCSHIPNEKEDTQWIARRGLVSKTGNTETVQKFLDELSIFAVAQPQSQETTEQTTLVRQEESTETPVEETNEPQECLWKAAQDPHSGRTYYYHSVTRKTQWHKPEEIRAMEKRAREEKKRLDKLFFKEMECNIYASLKKKESIPGVTASVALPSTPAAETPSIEGTKQRVRTISNMDETLLAQLFIGNKPPASTTLPVVPKKTTTVNAPPVDVRGRPPLPRRSTSVTRVDSMSLSPDETRQDGKEFRELDRHDSDLLAGEKLLDAPILNENVSIGGEDNGIAVVQVKNHVRRNTGGTIYVKSTMTNPDIKATIKCVCGVYRAHILQAAEKSASNSPNSVCHTKDELAQVFVDDQSGHTPKDLSEVPSLDQVITFYENFYERSQMEIDTIIMSLIYVEKLIKETNGLVVPRAETWKSILFSCMVLASKVWDDLSMWNVDFSNVSRRHLMLASFTLRRINELELAVLKCLNFIVRVPASEYAKYYFLIRCMLMKSGDLNEVGDSERSLDMEELKNLEAPNSNYEAAGAASIPSNTNARRSRSLNDHDFDAFRPRKNETSVALEQLVTMNR